MTSANDPVSTSIPRALRQRAAGPHPLHMPHPHIAVRREQGPATRASGQTSLNARIAVALTASVGTMWCAYLFVGLAIAGFPFGPLNLHDLVQWVSQTFIQLVMLSVIMVGQSIMGAASDKRAIQTYDDAEAILHSALAIVDRLETLEAHVEAHLHTQDEHLTAQDTRLDALEAAASPKKKGSPPPS